MEGPAAGGVARAPTPGLLDPGPEMEGAGGGLEDREEEASRRGGEGGGERRGGEGGGGAPSDGGGGDASEERGRAFLARLSPPMQNVSGGCLLYWRPVS